MGVIAPGGKTLTVGQLSASYKVPILDGPQSADTLLSTLAAYLAGSSTTNMVNTAISTAGAGILTAAGLVGGLITRTGPTGAYTDTTATAAAIITALGGAVGQSQMVFIKNTVAFASTLAAGVGVTLAGQGVIPPLSMGMFLMTYTAAGAVTLLGMGMVPLTTPPILASTALSTVGAGVITGAGIAGGLTTRSGEQTNTAFTDTTDTAVAIIAAIPNASIGQSFIYKYRNTTDASATITGGVGVTVSSIAVVPPNVTVEFLVTYTAAATITMVGISRTAPSTTSGTFTLNGATPVSVANTIITANSAIIMTLKTVGGTVSPNGPNQITITAGTGFTVAGTASDSSTYNYLVIN